ncbi:DUF6503 family protein [Fulvivirgaceae bacterium LMO-SS25]
MLKQTKTVSFFLLSFTVFGMIACQEKIDAQAVVSKSINVHGGDLYENSTIEFSFRDRDYKIHRDGGIYNYERIFTDSLGTFHDFLNNDYFAREIDGQHFRLSEEDSLAQANSLNSVVYFALLPYFLNDPAVYKTMLDDVEIDGENYYKIKVSFSPEGGGVDFEDEYVYWFNKDGFTMDYLAYSFHVNGGGTRFRKAINRREINGIIFQDYINYTAATEVENIANFDQLLKDNKLEQVSIIDLKNVVVRR